MQHAIVEGEPGIFPAPVANVMQKIRGFFDRKRQPDAGRPSSPEPNADPEPEAQPEPEAEAGPEAEPAPEATDTDEPRPRDS